MGLTYHKNEDATTHPEACKHSLRYDRRPDLCLKEWAGTWNLGGPNGKGGDLCEELREEDRCALYAGGEMERAGC